MRRVERIGSVLADVDPTVRKYLRELEATDSLVYGTVIDVSTIDPSDPIKELDFEEPQLVAESRSILNTVINSGQYENLIAVAVELPSDSVFIDLYTYAGSQLDDFPSIEAFAQSVGVDQSSVHHLVGTEVPVAHVDNRLRIVQDKSYSIKQTVTRADFLFPGIIAGLLIPLLIGLGISMSQPVIPFAIGGIMLSVLTYAVLLYFWLGVNREHPVVGLQSQFVEDHIDWSAAEVDTSILGDVENATVTGFGTFAPSDESTDKRTILYNFYIEVEIHPVGEVKVPIRSPALTWSGSVAKRAVYEVTPSIESLERSYDKALPVYLNDEGRVRVDKSRLSEPISDQRTVKEELADGYVTRVNDIFDLPGRSEYFDY